MSTNRLSITTGAMFSRCRLYRYALWRVWGNGGRYVMFIGLNPSTADATKNDPTIRRCIGFAQDWGFDGVYVLNLFAFRSTDPKCLRRAQTPIGPNNARWMRYYAARCETIVAAWGADRLVHKSGTKLLSARWLSHTDIQCLGHTKQGFPKHPLYVAQRTSLRSLAITEPSRGGTSP